MGSSAGIAMKKRERKNVDLVASADMGTDAGMVTVVLTKQWEEKKKAKTTSQKTTRAT